MTRQLSSLVSLSALDWIEVDLSRNRAIIEGEVLRVSAHQAELLFVLAKNRGKVASHDLLIRSLWGADEPENVAACLRHAIYELRKKLCPLRYKIMNYKESGYELVRATSNEAAKDTAPAPARSRQA